MKIIQPSVKLLWITPDPERAIEVSGRTCYKSEDKITPTSAGTFCQKMVNSGHHAMLEHACASFRIITDRGISHEIVRHRLASYAQECVSGDTELVAYRSNTAKGRSQNKWTIKTLADWQNDPKRCGRLKLIRLRSVDKEGRIVPGKIEKVLGPKLKQVYKLVCKSGKTLTASEEHRFMVKGGNYKQLKDLIVGERIYANGIPALENKDWLYTKYITENNTLVEMSKLCGCCVSYITRALRKHGINKPLAMRKNRQPGHGVKGMFSPASLKRLSDAKLGNKNPNWKGDGITLSGGYARSLRSKEIFTCWGCNYTGDTVQNHHMDKNPCNNAATNILPLCPSCHKSFHIGAGVLTVYLDEIISITKEEVIETYDLVMQNSEHNFVANGLVVHNSTRYCNYGSEKFDRECSFIQPPNLTDPQYIRWEGACHRAEDHYNLMLEDGLSPQIARSVLPTSLKTELVMTANFREFRHFITLRSSLAAHPQIRPIATEIWRILMSYAPNIFKDLLDERELLNGPRL